MLLKKQLVMLRNVAERHQENTNGNSSCEESYDRAINSPTKSDANVMLVNCGQETNGPFYDSVAYFGEGSEFLDIKEQLCSVNDWDETTCNFGPDLQKWWEV